MELFTVVGLAAAALTTFSFIPQAIKVIRTKHTKDLSLSMYTAFTLGILLWLIYGIMTKDAPIIVANIVTVILASIILVMKIKYK